MVGDEGKSLTFLHKHLVEIIGGFSDRQDREEFLVDIPECRQDYNPYKILAKKCVFTSVDQLGPS